MGKLAALQRAKTDPAVVEALWDVVNYAKEREIQYGYEMRIRGTNAVVDPGELDKHLNDEIVVTIHVGPCKPSTKVEWNPPANWYITRLVIP